jgi:hypothetical protein
LLGQRQATGNGVRRRDRPELILGAAVDAAGGAVEELAAVLSFPRWSQELNYSLSLASATAVF